MDIIDVAELMAKISPARVLREVLSKSEVQQYIIELNTEGQLLEGINSLGVKLSEVRGYGYSVKTMKIKGLTDPNKINLFDTGDYYKTFIVVPLNNGNFIIKSDPTKGTGNLEDGWGKDNKGGFGKDLEGLTNENLEKLNIYLEDKIIEHLENMLM